MSDGFLPSVVRIGGVARSDTNGFITALGVRALRLAGRRVPAEMLTALESCASDQGGFRFWPPGRRPGWAPALPDDTDDTAVMTLELYRAGRLDLSQARRIACLTLGRQRIRRVDEPGPVWRRVGVFKTWHRDATQTDVIDCTANANALALFAALGLAHLPGFRETCDMLESALAFASDSESRAASLSPFYPHPAELVLALGHAVQCGATALAPLHARARCTAWGAHAERQVARGDHAVCSSAYGSPLWFSPALAWLRSGR